MYTNKSSIRNLKQLHIVADREKRQREEPEMERMNTQEDEEGGEAMFSAQRYTGVVEDGMDGFITHMAMLKDAGTVEEKEAAARRLSTKFIEEQLKLVRLFSALSLLPLTQNLKVTTTNVSTSQHHINTQLTHS